MALDDLAGVWARNSFWAIGAFGGNYEMDITGSWGCLLIWELGVKKRSFEWNVGYW